MRAIGESTLTADPFVSSVLAADPRARRVLAIMRAMSDAEAEAWLRAGQRIAQGVEPAAAEALLCGELGREVPGRRAKAG